MEWFEELPQGCLLYFEGHKEPLRGLVSIEVINAAWIWKRSIVLFLGFLQGNQQYDFEKTGIFKKIAILLSLAVNYRFYVNFINEAIYDYTFDDPKKFSPAIRAIYNVFPEGLKTERDIICFFLNDHAYLFRFQDIFPELDKEAFRKNPLKETLRLLDLMISRDSEGTMQNKWRMLRKTLPALYYYIRFFKRKLYKQLLKMAEDIDLEKIKPTKEDIYWMNDMESSYKFRGLSREARKLLNK